MKQQNVIKKDKQDKTTKQTRISKSRDSYNVVTMYSSLDKFKMELSVDYPEIF